MDTNLLHQEANKVRSSQLIAQPLNTKVGPIDASTYIKTEAIMMQHWMINEGGGGGMQIVLSS